jgi:hypothetical protein
MTLSVTKLKNKGNLYEDLRFPLFLSLVTSLSQVDFCMFTRYFSDLEVSVWRVTYVELHLPA